MKHTRPTVVYAAAVRDATGVNASPGAVLVQNGRVVMAGEPGWLPAELVEQADVIDRRGDLLLPAMVNAHTHLELTDIGPQPYDPEGGFVGWIKLVRSLMPKPSELQPSAQRGAEFANTSGIQAVGDIASSVQRAEVRSVLGLDGVTYQELFGIGPSASVDAWQGADLLREGLQPHAPYSAAGLYFRAAQSGMPVSTHLAETLDELAFVARQSGSLLEYLKELGRWDDAYKKYYGTCLTPVKWMEYHLQEAKEDGGWLVAHCNYVSDDDIAILADTNTSVAYCPIASEYFGHKAHRYRDMLAAGINVCLGTDSIVGTDPNDPQPLGLLSAMRRLYERDRTDPDTLLAMATTHGARALRLNGGLATLQPGAAARFACLPVDPASQIDPLIQVLTRQDPVEAVSFDPPA